MHVVASSAAQMQGFPFNRVLVIGLLHLSPVAQDRHFSRAIEKPVALFAFCRVQTRVFGEHLLRRPSVVPHWPPKISLLSTHQQKFKVTRSWPYCDTFCKRASALVVTFAIDMVLELTIRLVRWCNHELQSHWRGRIDLLIASQSSPPRFLFL